MKLKGINPIEQHIEKIVLAVVGIVFVGVLAVQFVIAPNEVTYDNQKIAPSEVLGKLGDDAKAVLSRMQDPEPSLPEVPTPDLVAQYQARLGESGFGGTRLASGSFGAPFEVTYAQVDTQTGPVTPLRLPAPGETLAASQWTTVDPFFARATPVLDPYMPEAQPLDKVSVTVEAKLSGKLIREALESADEGHRAIPSHWWSDGDTGLIEVLTVEAERQMQNPDGSWGEPERVGTVRWTPGVLEAFNEGAPEGETLPWDGMRAADLLSAARMAQDDPSLASQPAFLPSIAGVEWVQPSKVSERQARLEIEARIGRVEREIAGLEEDITRIKDRQAAAGNQSTRTTRSQPSNTGTGLRVGPGASSGTTRSNRPNRPDPYTAQITNKETEIAEKQDELVSLDEQLAELGGDPQATRRQRRPQQPAQTPGAGARAAAPVLLGAGGGTPTRSRTTRGTRRNVSNRTPGAESPGPLLGLDEYSVWVHDFTAEPGVAYRYRVRYGVNNPLFKRERSLGSEDPEVLALAADPIVESDWSGWSTPVSVGRSSYFFVTSARDQGQLGQSASSATAEVFRMFYGYYRKHTISLEPGDAVQGEFRLPEDLPLFDVKGVTEEDLLAYFDEREQEEAVPGRPLGASDEDEEAEERDWLTLVAPRYPLAVDAVMLDVAEYPIAERAALPAGRAARVFEVLFFDPISGVVARRPDRDREMEEYARVQQSAGLAESAAIRRPDPEYIP